MVQALVWKNGQVALSWADRMPYGSGAKEEFEPVPFFEYRKGARAGTLTWGEYQPRGRNWDAITGPDFTCGTILQCQSPSI